MSRRKKPPISNDILDQLLVGTDAVVALNQGGLLDSLKKAFVERALNADGSPSWAGGAREQESERLRLQDSADRWRPGIGLAVSTRSLSPSTSGASPASMTAQAAADPGDQPKA